MNRELTTFRLLRWVSRIWRRHLTSTGRVFVAVLLVCVPLLLASDSGLLLLMAPLVASLLTALTVGWLYRPRLELVAQPISSLMRGQRTCIECEVRNLGRLPAIGLEVRWGDVPPHWGAQLEPVAVRHLKGGESRRIVLPVIAANRGFSGWPPIEVIHRVPLHLVCFRKSFPISGTVSVYPSYRRLRNCPAIGFAADEALDSRASQAHVGESQEYLGNREYQTGMPVRRWDFRSWARLGRPIVREYTDPDVRQAAMLIDLFAEPDDPASDLEETLSLAAAACDTLTAQGVRITPVALGHELVDLASLPASRIVASVLHRMATATVPLYPLEDWVQHLRPAIVPGQAVIVVLHAGDHRRKRLVRDLHRLAMKVTCVSIASRWIDHSTVSDSVQLVPREEFLWPSSPPHELAKRPGVPISGTSVDATSRPAARTLMK